MLDLIADAIADFKSQTFVTPEAAIAEANRIAAQFSTADPQGSFSERTALFYSGDGSGKEEHE